MRINPSSASTSPDFQLKLVSLPGLALFDLLSFISNTYVDPTMDMMVECFFSPPAVHGLVSHYYKAFFFCYCCRIYLHTQPQTFTQCRDIGPLDNRSATKQGVGSFSLPAQSASGGYRVSAVSVGQGFSKLKGGHVFCIFRMCFEW